MLNEPSVPRKIKADNITYMGGGGRDYVSDRGLLFTRPRLIYCSKHRAAEGNPLTVNLVYNK